MSNRFIALPAQHEPTLNKWLEAKPLLNQATKLVNSARKELMDAIREALARNGAENMYTPVNAGSGILQLRQVGPAYSAIITPEMVGQRLLVRSGYDTLDYRTP